MSAKSNFAGICTSLPPPCSALLLRPKCLHQCDPPFCFSNMRGVSSAELCFDSAVKEWELVVAVGTKILVAGSSDAIGLRLFRRTENGATKGNGLPDCINGAPGRRTSFGASGGSRAGWKAFISFSSKSWPGLAVSYSSDLMSLYMMTARREPSAGPSQ